MSVVFPARTGRLLRGILAGAILLGAAVLAGVWYYFTPKHTRVGYQPLQPVAFSHRTHVEQLGMDCRYCHSDVERAGFANLPASATCMNCHNQVLPDDPRLALVRESAATGRPISWVRIHRLPDYVCFNHAVHVNRGVGCVECHGRVDQMDEVYHARSLSMVFCLECHRDPASRLRPLDKITDPGWTWSADPTLAAQQQRSNGARWVRDWKIQSLESCSACHR